MSNKKTNESTTCAKLCRKRHNNLPTRASFFISKPGKIESVWEFKIQVFGVAVSLQMTVL